MRFNVILAIFFLSGFFLFAQKGCLFLSVNMKEVDGATLQNTTVQMKTLDPFVDMDKNGNFSFNNLPGSNYTLRISSVYLPQYVRHPAIGFFGACYR